MQNHPFVPHFQKRKRKQPTTELSSLLILVKINFLRIDSKVKLRVNLNTETSTSASYCAWALFVHLWYNPILAL